MDSKGQGNGLSWGAKAAIAIIVLAAAIAAALLAYAWAAPELESMSAKTLEDAVVARANQCFAIEGAYPPNLKYLEDNYGLVVNKNDYMVTYEVFADNVPPNIFVVPK